MPHSTSAPRLGDLERVVMEHLWEAASVGGPMFDGATVREVHDRFEGEREIAYTTVMTVLDRLAKKDLVTRERDGRAWRYFPADTREALTAQTMRAPSTTWRSPTGARRCCTSSTAPPPTRSADLKAALAEIEARAEGEPATSATARGASAAADADPTPTAGSDGSAVRPGRRLSPWSP